MAGGAASASNKAKKAQLSGPDSSPSSFSSSLPSFSSPAVTVVLDNGAGTAKIGFGGEKEPRMVVPNCTARLKHQAQVLVADDIVSKVKDSSQLQLTRPFERGHLTNWNCERDVWDRLFGPQGINIDPRASSLLLTAPVCSPELLMQDMYEVVFEEYGFHSALFCPSARLVTQHLKDLKQPSGGSSLRLVVESGFSFTHILPMLGDKLLMPGVRRLDVGGKLLTNYLKEVVSYRQWNMMDETLLMNQVKEDLCYVSLDYLGDLQKSQEKKRRRNAQSNDEPQLLRHWVLPDYVHNSRGYVLEQREAVDGENDMQVLTMGIERIAVPEVLFHPSDVGLNQAGLPEAIVQAVSALPPAYHTLLYSNIVLAGGNVKMPNFRQRLEKDLRPLVPSEYEVGVFEVDDPNLAPWKGGSSLSVLPDFHSQTIGLQQYREGGFDYCYARWP